MVVSLKNVSMVSSKLLVTAKSVAADPSAPNARNQLAAAARWEHLLTNQTLKVPWWVICFLYCVFSQMKLLVPLSASKFSFSSLSPFSSSDECIIALATRPSYSYLSSSLVTPGSHGKLVAALLFPYFLSCGTLTLTCYVTCYHNIHTSVHSIFCH